MDFNSRPCVRGDAEKHTFTARASDFNSRPCVRGDTVCIKDFAAYSAFQFTPLREGRQCTFYGAEKREEFQFTPLREGRLGQHWKKLHRTLHFNSRPCVRGDHMAQEPASMQRHFNSRPCVRGDSSRRCEDLPRPEISIHAPA